MSKKHLNLIFPQWQGGGQDLSTYHGAMEFLDLYLNQVTFTEIAVHTDEVKDIVNNIFGYNIIISQMQQVHDFINQETPDTIFTVGGGCDANIPAVTYLNYKLNGDMTVLWLDSHGDLNTPQSSPSKNFYGMPLRTMLGDGDDKIIKSFPSKLAPFQVVLLGIRDLDSEEQSYIESCSIPVLSVLDIEQHFEAVRNVIRSKGSKNLYIHIDLDVLEPTQFPFVPLPAPNGLNMDTLQSLICTLNTDFNIIGLGLVEYQPTGKKRYKLFEEICKIGTGL